MSKKAPAAFKIEVIIGPPMQLAVAACGGSPKTYPLGEGRQADYLDLFEALARDFGLRRPLARVAPTPHDPDPRLKLVLDAPVSPAILYGYGDPCVVRVGVSDYRLLVTSNDAPDGFPILASGDLKTWRLSGFVFPDGEAPDWTLTGLGVSDFWAPEMHRVGDEWWVCFTAREHDGALAIGIARSTSPDGPFIADRAPIVRGGVIDSHILIDANGAPWLVWKKDDNDVWPSKLSALLHASPSLTPDLFGSDEDRRTASFVSTLWPWIATLAPMEQFFAQQPMIEAVAEDLAGFAARLAAAQATDQEAVATILAALRTRIYAQPLSSDGRSLLGEPSVILQNDAAWEGHLIEGAWITEDAGRYYLLYAGNDFSTALYGIGVAAADAPQGPYLKQSEAFLTSNRDWWGPGHPSVVRRDDGGHQIFLHAFRPGEAGYKQFRALLTGGIEFRDGHVSLASDKSY